MDPAGNWTLPPDTTAAGVARRIVASALASWRDPDDAVLVVSELVTNAVQHGLPPIELELNLGAGRLRLTVSNAVGAALSVPRLISPGDDEPHGRGLAIVERLSAGWGWSGTDQMISVWAELIDSTVGGLSTTRLAELAGGPDAVSIDEHTAVSEVHITASARVNRSCE
jgi:anti-sigma regulatory factor (Ser/Thr protein kinase)